jgi:hypothetical protein
MSLPEILFQQLLFDELERWKDVVNRSELCTLEMRDDIRRESVASGRRSKYTGNCLDRLVCAWPPCGSSPRAGVRSIQVRDYLLPVQRTGPSTMFVPSRRSPRKCGPRSVLGCYSRYTFASKVWTAVSTRLVQPLPRPPTRWSSVGSNSAQRKTGNGEEEWLAGRNNSGKCFTSAMLCTVTGP